MRSKEQIILMSILVASLATPLLAEDIVYLQANFDDQNHALGIIFDMDEGTYDIWWNGQLTIQDETHGIEGRGIGAVLIGTFHDPDVGSHFFIDDLLVANYLPTADSEAASWGSIKALFH